MRILLSYNASDAWLTEALRASIFIFDPDLNFVLSPDPCSASSGRRSRSAAIRDFDALLLVAGPSGLSVTQEAEWMAGIKRAAQDDKFVLLPVLAGRAQPPQHLELHNRVWFQVPVVTDRNVVCRIVEVFKGRDSWLRHLCPSP